MGNPYNQLTLDERYQIKALYGLNYSARKIARRLGRSNKTNSRELKQSQTKTQDYCAESSHNKAYQRRQEAAKAHKKSDSVIDKVRQLLILKMTPEQISGRMKLESYTEAISRQTI